jgi:GNAT superfamily N-acetyltransferase
MMPQIRPATADDVAALAHVHATAWQWAYRDQMPDEFLDGISVARQMEIWQTSLAAEQDRTLVADTSEGVVGFVSVGLMRTGPHESRATDAIADGPITAELYAIYLLEDWAGRGVGTSLMHAGEQAMRDLGASRAVLWVLASNSTTHRFYEARGWGADGETTTYEIGGEQLPVVRYSKHLQ